MKKGSIESEKHPYLRLAFWEKKENHFWENQNYTDNAKNYFRKWIKSIFKKVK